VRFELKLEGPPQNTARDLAIVIRQVADALDKAFMTPVDETFPQYGRVDPSGWLKIQGIWTYEPEATT
jgi:hypothetical protein